LPPGYELLAELGRGGMGVVYKVRHKVLSRVVALKMILVGGHAGDADLARFLSEAETVAQLQHPGIVQLFEFGQHGGLPYFTLEFIPGGTLAGRLRSAAMSPQEVARVVEKLARGMHYAHQRGIVHRDLKPANVLMGPDGAPKITDFGLVKRTEVGDGLTATGAVMGTPSYMAPEQAGGRGKEVGPAADIYALGAILYECLTGRPPFRAATKLDTLMQVLSDEPVPPRQRHPRVPRDLDTICLKCLEKDPRRRYPSAEALADDLRRYLSHEPIVARRTGIWEQTVKFARRQPLIATLLTCASLGVLIGLFIQWQFSSKLIDISSLSLAPARTTAPALPAVRNPGEVPYPPREVIDRTLAGFAYRVWCVAFSPDGKRLAAGGDEPVVRVWDDPLTNPLPQVLQGHSDSVYGLAFAPNGSLLATGSGDRTVKVWDASSRLVKRTLAGHRRRVLAVAFSHDGKLLASAGDDEVIKLWDPESGELVRELAGHTDAVYGLAFGAEGRLASVSHDRTVILWDATQGRCLHQLSGHDQVVRAVTLSPDGATVASAGWDGAVRLWNATTGQVLDHLGPLNPQSPKKINSLAFSPDGKLLFTAEERELNMWDVQARQPAPGKVSGGPYGIISCVTVSPDGKAIAFAGWDRLVRIKGPFAIEPKPPPMKP
jgi:serine/threonine protein kinase